MDNRTILCVDDEVNVLHALKRLFRKEAYSIFTANNGPEALELLKKETVQVVISDQRMPEITGTELLQKVKEEYPETIRVVLSGYADVGVILDAINQGEIYRFLTKPWNDEELKVSIRQCFSHYDLVKENQLLVKQVHVQNEELRNLNNQLHEVVNERTRSLHLSQEILEKLPLPVIGISQEGIIALANEAVRQKFPSFRCFAPGNDIEDCFPEVLQQAISACIRGDSPTDIPTQMDGRALLIRLKPLLNTDKLSRGCILVLQEEIR